MLRPLGGICVAVALTAAVTTMSLLYAQETGGQEYEEYEGQTLNTLEARRRVEGRPIAVKDIFERGETALPRDVERAGVSLRRFVAFRARDGFGSGLLCLMRRDNEAGMEVLPRIVPGDNILMLGRIQRLGTVHVFYVEELYRGHTRPPVRSVVLTVSDASDRNQRTYRLREAGQKYRVRSPYDDRVIHVSFQFDR